MDKPIVDWTVAELKVFAYDCRNNLNVVEQELANRLAKAKLDKVAEDAKPK